ncbi:uncharacterized protein VTP21DRAFT_45 [Calcarisporiella thermophila]|uniref:uncharacterized protein n=1 Tax=Calcarisporiella thermophila TaxID=911321 RepID=UPI0037440730
MEQQHQHPLQFLIGTWEGLGYGQYPTAMPFEYVERTTFELDPYGRNILTFKQDTWYKEDPERHRHTESGFLNYINGKIVLLVAQGTGLTAVEEGVLEGTTLRLKTASIARVSSDNGHVVAWNRELTVDKENDKLVTFLDMQTEHVPMTRHLDSTLSKIN